MVKRYRSTWADECEMLVDIDHSIMTEAALKEINAFWSEADYRLMLADGNVLHVVLKMLHRRVLYLDTEHGYNLEGLIGLFDYDSGNGQEGWPKMDGTEGMTLIAVDSLDFDSDRMEIEEVS